MAQEMHYCIWKEARGPMSIVVSELVGAALLLAIQIAFLHLCKN